MTPGSAALPRELSLNPQQSSSDLKASKQMPNMIRLTPEPSEPVALSHREHVGLQPFSSPGLGPAAPPLGGSQAAADFSCQQLLSDSSACFEFAKSPASAYARTAKLSQPAQLGSQIPSQAANSHRVPATVQLDLSLPTQSGSVSPPPNSAPSRAMGQAQGRPVHNSPEPGAMRNPRTSIEDLSQMHSCLNQLEQQLVDMPRPVSRGAKGRPSTTEAASARHHNRQQPLHMHVQQPGDAALGQTVVAYTANDSVSFLRPPMQHSVQSSQKVGSSAIAPAAEEEEASRAEEGQDRASRPSSAGSVASQPQFAVLKARVGARRQEK